MALREMVIERVSGLKKRKLTETPILKELPTAAKIISSEMLAFPEVDGKIPVIARGKAYGETPGLWYHVAFPRPMINPSVVPVGEARRGVIPIPKAPSITVAPVSIGIVSTKVPKAAAITVPEVSTRHVPTSLGRFECGWALASITDGLNDFMATIESVLVRVNEIIDDTVSTVKNIRSSLTSLDAKVDDLRAKVNEALESLRVNTEKSENTGFETLRKNTQSAVNKGLAAVIPSLYDAWGIPETMVLTPLHVRNVTATGFEFQSYGQTTCYWIAVGSLR